MGASGTLHHVAILGNGAVWLIGDGPPTEFFGS